LEAVMENTFTFYKLEWDTDFFGVTCAKAILLKSLSLPEWNMLQAKFKEYQFVSIENRNSEPINAQLIGKFTSAYLVDVNIQFAKKTEPSSGLAPNIKIHSGLETNEQIIDIAHFQVSKFTEDPELNKRGGKYVYQQWLLNSFGKTHKYHAVSYDEQHKINGFLLHSYSNDICSIELIAVSNDTTKRGIGTKLFRAVEFAAFQHKAKEIKVGTQLRNMSAINFYHKLGCKQAGCHQIYHLWNM